MFSYSIRLNVEYCGGDEGESKIQWFRTTPEGKYEEIEGTLCSDLSHNLGANRQSYQPTSKDTNCRLEVKYIPVRDDGLRGLPIFVVSKPVLKGE